MGQPQAPKAPAPAPEAPAPEVITDLQVLAAVLMADIFAAAHDFATALALLNSVGIVRGEDPRLAVTTAHFLQARGLLPASLELPELLTQEPAQELS